MSINGKYLFYQFYILSLYFSCPPFFFFFFFFTDFKCVHYNLINRQYLILTLTILWADSADDKLVIFFLFDLTGDNLHNVSDPVF